MIKTSFQRLPRVLCQPVHTVSRAWISQGWAELNESSARRINGYNSCTFSVYYIHLRIVAQTIRRTPITDHYHH